MVLGEGNNESITKGELEIGSKFLMDSKFNVKVDVFNPTALVPSLCTYSTLSNIIVSLLIFLIHIARILWTNGSHCF